MSKLSAAQAEIWLAQQLEPDSAKYNLCEYIEISGPVDEEHFEGAVRRAVAEVESLNVRFTTEADGSPRQHYAATPDWPFRHVDLTDVTDPEEAAHARMRADADELTDPRVQLTAGAQIKLGTRRYFWFQRYHHIAIDGLGMSLIAARVAEIYTALVERTTPGSHRFGSLSDLLAEEERYRGSAQYDDDLTYWRQQLSDWPGPGLLKPGAAPAASTCYRSSTRLPEDLITAVRHYSKALGTSMPRLLTAAVAVYVRHVSGCSDITLSFVFGGRGSEPAPVTMANIVPLRVPIAADDSVAQVVESISQRTSEAKAHQRYRCEDIHRQCLPGTLSRSFGPMVNVYRFDYGFRFAGHPATGMNLATGPIEDISFSFHDRADGNGITAVVEANPRRYSADETCDHLRRLVHVLRQITELPTEAPVRQIGIATDAERDRILFELSRGESPDEIPARRVHELFEHQVRESPDAPAVICGDVGLTYTELNTRANRLAGLLADLGVTRGDIVAVAMERDHDLVAALLAVWKVGAAYLPVEPDQPTARVAGMLETAHPSVLLTSESTDQTFAGYPAGTRLTVNAERTRERLERYPGFDLDHNGEPTDLAYVIFTSGSTGRPKGVAVEHGSLHAYLLFAVDTYPGLATSAAVHTPVSFDLTVTGLYGPLVSGGNVTLIPRLEEHGGGEYGFVKATPAHLPLLESRSVRPAPGGSLVLGGEQLLWKSVARWRAAHPDVLVFNEYGPTEATVGCCVRTVRPHDEIGTDAVPIGRPMNGVRLYVLDSLCRPLPPGFVGELYIAGDGLARGYLGDPIRTAERFVTDSFGRPGSRMYRTGDLARWRTDGDLEFLGRVDDQVKVRGHRIELGEIEAALTAHPEVAAAVVKAEPIGDMDRRLVGYVVAAENGSAPSVEGLRDWAAARLPEYMIPRTFMVLDEFPLSGNGKVDRDRLPTPTVRSRNRAAAGATTQEADLLCALFADVLGVEEVFQDDDFVELGGSSLTGVQLVTRVGDTLNRGFSIADLFRLRTPARLSEYLHPRRQLPPIRRVKRNGRIPLSYAQRRLWYLAQLQGDTSLYHLRRAHRLRGRLDGDVLRTAFEDVVARHEILRTVIRSAAGNPYQLVVPPRTSWFHADDIDDDSMAEQIERRSRAPFDLAEDPPLRVDLLTVAEDDHVLLVTLHHGAADAWSLALLYRDLAAAYAARAEGEDPEWASLPIQYADYAAWQHAVFAGADAPADQETYWSTTLADAPDCSGPRTDRPRCPVATYRGGEVPFHLPADVHAGMAQLARRSGVTLFMIAHTCLLLMLKAAGAPDDTVIGTPTAGRADDKLSDLVGCFLNMVPLRTDTSGDPTIEELLARVRDTDLAALANQDVPFDRIVEIVAPRRSMSRHPIFQVVFTFNNTPEAALRIPGVEVSEFPVESTTAKWDLTLDLTEQRTSDGEPGGLTGMVEYASDLFDHATAAAMAAQLERICRVVVEAAPDSTAADLVSVTRNAILL